MNVAVKDMSFSIEGCCDVKLLIGQQLLVLTDVIYSSKLRQSLITGPQLDKNGLEFHGGRGEVILSLERYALYQRYAF